MSEQTEVMRIRDLLRRRRAVHRERLWREAERLTAAAAELGVQRVAEIVDRLSDPAETLNLQVARGDKVVEVKRGNINKGRVALRWTERENWDFILAMGDSWTDEDMFAALPDDAFTIKVGLAPSRARFNLESTGDVRKFLKELADN